MSKYQIWDKTSKVITPIGEVLSANEWKERYPLANIEGVDLVIAGGTINGAFCQEYTSFKEIMNLSMKASGIPGYEEGIPEDLSEQEVLDFIEAFENVRSMPSNVPSTEERIAAALEAQVMMSLPDAD